MEALDKIKAQQLKDTGSSALASNEEHLYSLGKQEIELQKNAQNLGWLGRFFGANSHAPTNIAGVTALAGTVGLFCTIFFVQDGAIGDKLITTFTGIVMACLGYMFGAKGKK
jgi:hypothetical protein